MLVTASEVKTFIGLDLTDTEYDTEVEALVPDAEAMLYSILKVDSLEENSKTEWWYYDCDRNTLSVSNFPITWITKIWWVDYSGVENTDYIITGTMIEFINIPSADIINGKVSIEYNYWYVAWSVPKNVKLAVKYLASWLWNTKKEVWVSAVKIWQESYNFTSISDSEDFKKIISQIRTSAKVFIL